MLNQLSVRNVAVIDKLDINLHDGVSVLTGETGAGKSIIIDSINMILGDRANKELVRYGTDKAVVQAVFDAPKSVINILEENDIDVEDETVIITRQVTKEGKSVARINGMVVTLNILREISDRLINIHGQHDNQALLTPIRHITFLDAYADNEEYINRYKDILSKKREIEKKISSLEMDEQEKMQRIDLLEYQVKEIKKASLEKVGMSGYENRLIGNLSGGQQQRIFIARALISEPELLLMDEPTVGVDAKSVRQIMDIISELNKQGMTIIMTNHDTPELVRVSDKLLIFCEHGNGEFVSRNDLTMQQINEIFAGKRVHHHG